MYATHTVVLKLELVDFVQSLNLGLLRDYPEISKSVYYETEL